MKSSRHLLALPLMGLALTAAKPAPVAVRLPPPPSAVAPADVAADPQNTLRLELSNGGAVTIQLRPDVAPGHIERIRTLARRGFYDGITFHRVIPGFMAQTGDPKGTGAGGSELPDLPAEFNALPHMRGTVAAARTDDPNTFNSQFFIMLAPRFGLDHKYTVIGRVVGGMASVDSIAVGEPPAEPTRIVRASVGAPAVAVAAAPVAAPAAPVVSSAPATVPPAAPVEVAPTAAPTAVPVTPEAAAPTGG